MLVALIVATTYVLLQAGHVEAAPKSTPEHKINFGWPSFFNPEMGMMREKDKKGKEEAENNEVSDSYEDLVDYTIKGGLRGTLLVLNASEVLDVVRAEGEVSNLTQVATKLMMEEEEEDSQEEEEEEDEEEVVEKSSDEGVKVRTPLVVKKRNRELGKYGAKITFHAGTNATTFIYYGNWCGKGGRSAPVDNLDRCCLAHEMCYGRTVRDCPDVWDKPYNTMYGWAMMGDEPVCVRSESYCINHVCECDRKAALCFHHYLTSPDDITSDFGPEKW